MKDDKQNEHHADLHIHKDNYVVVSYAGKKLSFITSVLDEEDEDVDIEVRFLRKAHKRDIAYVGPVVEDIHAVPVTSVQVVLPRLENEQYPTT